jgi:hypothetical protein
MDNVGIVLEDIDAAIAFLPNRPIFEVTTGDL